MSTNEVLKGLNDEIFQLSDSVWREGMAGWSAISDVFSLEARSAYASLRRPVISRAPAIDLEEEWIPGRAVIAPPASRPPAIARNDARKRFTARRFQTLGLALIALSVIFVGLRKSIFEAAGFGKGGAAFGHAQLGLSERALDAFEVRANYPDATRVQVRVEGVAETLLGLPDYSGKTFVSLKKGVAHTESFVVPGGRPLPPGEYKVKVLSEDGREITSRSFFLGGSRDQEYERQLELYHGILRDQAKMELSELKQYLTTLEDQLTLTDREFQSLWERARSSTRGEASRGWRQFNRSWQRMQDQLYRSNQQWSEALGSSTLFYGVFFEQAQAAAKRVNEVHQDEGSYFDATSGQAALEEKIAESASLAESAILSLKLKVALAQKKTALPNGMPPKDGL